MLDQVYSKDEVFNRHCIGTQYIFALLPKRCAVSNKRLWFKFCYKRTAMYTGPGEPVLEYKFYDKTEYLLEKLKGNI